jgi:hypothetical protein
MGTTFLTQPVGSMKAADFGINGGWGGIRTTSVLLINLMQIQQTVVVQL